MPLFEYDCDNCGHTWEKINGLDREVCPQCRFVCDKPVQLPGKTRVGSLGKGGDIYNADV